jgi:hypothetical protein
MTDRPTASTINDAQLDDLHAALEQARARLGSALASVRLLRLYASQLDHDGQVGAADVARRIRRIVAGLDEPVSGPATTQAEDLTGYWAPDPPIHCLTATTPATPVVLRDPCPRCEDCPLIPRHHMADHMREHHPEEQ